MHGSLLTAILIITRSIAMMIKGKQHVLYKASLIFPRRLTRAIFSLLCVSLYTEEKAAL
jgi:hypothetical protein